MRSRLEESWRVSKFRLEHLHLEQLGGSMESNNDKSDSLVVIPISDH